VVEDAMPAEGRAAIQCELASVVFKAAEPCHTGASGIGG
jgi:hypothetical protein